MTAADVAAAIATTATPATDLSAGIAPVGRQYGVIVSTQGGTPPTVTITLAGSSTPIAGVRYELGYSPNVADTVIIDHVGTDVIVAGALASGAVGPSGGPVPVGCMLAFPAAFTDPAWLLCDGSTFSSVTYPALNTYLGGTTLPDARGVAVMGAGVNGIVLGTRDAVGKVISHAHTGDVHTHPGAAHTHTTDVHTHSHSHTGSGGNAFVAGGGSSAGIAVTGASYQQIANTSTDATGGGGGNTSAATAASTGAATAANTGLFGTGTANVPPNLGVDVYIRSL